MAATDSEEATSETEDKYLQEVAYVVPEDDFDDTTCSICHAEFLDAEDLNVHINQVHKDSTTYSNVCQFCDATYRDLKAYARHICEDHLVRLYCCRVCTKCFIEAGQWKKHERKHKSKFNMFSCSQCMAIFSSCKEVEVHEILNHNNTDDGEFVNCLPHMSEVLKLNAITYLQSDERTLVCSVCKFTGNIQSYLRHKKNKCVVYVCDICCYASNLRKNLIKHLGRKNWCRRPEEYDSDMTTCLSCKDKVHCRQMLSHMSSCNKYKCYVCDIRFLSVDALSEHQSDVHPVELDIIRCKFCNKEFVGSVALDKHTKRSHSHQFILYKYKCMECQQIFKHPQLLFAHYFTKHKDLEPYTCKICDKKFRVRKRFTIHIKLEHKSNGVVEFDDRYHVFFATKKSDNPFVPKCVIPELVPVESSKPALKVKTQEEINSEVSRNITNEEVMPTETEIEDENIESKPKKRALKRKRGKAVNISSSEEEEVEPLSLIKKRAERKKFQKLYSSNARKYKLYSNQRKQFTCKECNKYCYTYQNYQNHIQLHKKASVKCVKCSRSFKSRKLLSDHIAKDHATSKLIETLKNVLERKQVETGGNSKNTDDRNDDDLSPSERFMKTIKKVKPEKQTVAATISLSSGDLSVKNFIENFVPDVGEPAHIEQVPKLDEEEPTVTLKHYDSPFYRKHSIKMTKFVPEAPQTTVKLKMPEKFKAPPEDRIKLTVKMVQEPLKPSMFEQYDSFNSKFLHDNHHDYEDADNNDYYDDKNDVIPEVAQEVMLEGSEEPLNVTLQAPQKIVIPKLPEGYPKIHIATLQPQAPYYKIITVKNTDNTDEAIVIDTDKFKTESPTKEPERNPNKKDVISLPDGTKFVTANPLAHLLGGKPVEDLLLSTKYYKPAMKNFKGIFAEALQNLDKPHTPKQKERQAKRQKKKGETESKSLPIL